MGQENSKQVVKKTSLDLSNQFISQLPQTVGNYSELVSIDLHQNQITSIEALSQLKTLTFLDVSNNDLDMIHDMVFVNNSSLLCVLAEKNKITKITPLIGALPLFKLNFGNNLISIVPDTIGDCTCLTYLCFAHNQIVEIPPTISRLTSLKQLIICGNKIKSIPSLERCPITHLDLADNELDEFPSSICKCPLLKLYMDNNNISSITNDISLLVSLKELTLGSNVLHHLPKGLIQCASLQSLDLENNQLDAFYSTHPSISEIFEYLAGSDPIPSRSQKKVLSKSKMERRKESIEFQKSLQVETKTRVYEPAPPRRLLIRIFGEGDAAWVVLVKCEKKDGTPDKVTIYRNDCYIFDTGKQLIVFYGKDASKAKRNKTNVFVENLKTEKGIKQIEIIDGSKNKRVKTEELLKPFNAYFEIGVIKEKYKAKETMERISEFLKVFVIALQRHGPQILLVPGRPSINQLNTNTTVVIDTGVLVFVWCGKETSPTERTVAVLKAEELLDMSFRRRDKMEFVIEGAETQLFKEYFVENADGENERKVLGTDKVDGLNEDNERMMYEDMLKSMLEDITLNPLDFTYNNFGIDDEEYDYTDDDDDIFANEISSSDSSYVSEDYGRVSEQDIDIEEIRVVTPSIFESKKELGIEKEHIKNQKEEVKKEKGNLVEEKLVEMKVEQSTTIKESNKKELEKQKAEEEEEKKKQEQLEAEIKRKQQEEYNKKKVEEEKERIKEETRRKREEERQRIELERAKLEEERKKREQERIKREQERKKKEEELERIRKEEENKKKEIEEKERKKKEEEEEKERQVKEEQKKKELEEQQRKEEEERERKLEEEIKRIEEEERKLQEEEEENERKLQEEELKIKQEEENKRKEEELKIKQEEENKRKVIENKPLKDKKEWKDLVENEEVKTMNIKKRPSKKHRTKGTKTVAQAERDAVGSTKQTTEKATARVLAEDLLFQRKKLAAAPTGNARDIKRLIHIKGKRNPFARLVECSWESLNSGDAFIFDPGKGAKCIYVWLGKSSNKMEKGKAMELSKMIAKERGGVKTETIDEDNEPKEFWKALGEKEGKIKSAEDGGDDLVMELAQMKYVTLYKYWWDGLKEKVDIERWSYEGKEISKSSLEVNSCYILDCYSEMYMWVGTRVIKDRRQQYIQDCQKRYLERRKEVWVAPLYFEFPGYEQAMFKERFCDFYDNNTNIKKNPMIPFDDQKKIVRGSAVDYSMMLTKEIPIRKEVFIDNADGKKKVWRIDDFERVDAPIVGEFFESESYIIQYTYIKWNNEYHILYFWQGRKCPILDKGTSARLTVDLHRKLKDEAKEYRIAQNTETNHFLAIFEFMVIRLGKDPFAKEETKGKRTWDYDILKNTKKEQRLVFDIRKCGVNLEHVKAVEIEQHDIPNRLTSEGIFLITTENITYLWKGKLTGKKELEFTHLLIQKYNDVQRKDVIEMNEGEETEEFWNVIGGKRILKTKSVEWKNRLFEMSSKSGVFAVEEVTDWYQEDLEPKAAMLLDCYDICYLWIGKEISAIDKKFAMETTNEFIKRTKENERMNRECWLVYDGKEPFVFTNYFHGWRVNKKQVISVNDHMDNCLEELLKLTKTYSYDDLVHHRFPAGIDMSQLEHYLSDTEFEQVFKMTREQFEAQPKWKQQKQKHALKLY
ncbi:villidin, putative [Entamoeba nuttalli P19]|uniref:Villidin, putative n=1 Tax=Entamoeba nuttalli (strain P19) TaxID=1076696 RepID=K2HEL1_ENTNP|nr:villidin, putative [Entamoeba nuttalli P19]EKE41144.1 villidin, putative [Entamoeba nuttalli P19]|eukprot:XP_008856523.1 villidin, putative [Entamoeba nuttalli P19]